MSEITYREAQAADIAAMAEIRAGDWGTEEGWRERIRAYLAGEVHPREALASRVSYVGVDGETVVGLIAGHLTRRFGCDGEVQWISIRPEYRGRGIASGLLLMLAEWFVRHEAVRICVDVQPTNQAARRLYRRHGAANLKPGWMVWNDIRQALAVQRSLGL